MTGAEVAAAAAAFTPHDVSSALSTAMHAALWVLPTGTSFNDQRLNDLSEQGAPQFRGTEFRPVDIPTEPDAPERAVHVGSEGITLEHGPHWISHAWGNIVAAKRWTDAWTLFGRDGFTFTIRPDEWRGGESIHQTILASLSPEIVVTVPESSAAGR